MRGEAGLRLGLVAAVAGALLVLGLTSSEWGLYGDAAGYWSLSSSFERGGRFALEGYEDRLRGYVVPLMLWGVRQLAARLSVDPLVMFRVCSALVGALTFALVLPALVARLLGLRPSLRGAAMFAFLGVLFWWGHFLHPLSDFPALFLLSSGLLLLPHQIDKRWSAPAALLAGICLGLAAIARPINLATLAVATGLVGWYAVRHRARWTAVTAALLFVAGIWLAVWPQSSVNGRIFGTPNPFARARVGERAPSLYLQQLVWGLSIQRYETNLDGVFPVAVMFTDPGGQALLGLNPAQDPRFLPYVANTTYSSYLALTVRHPFMYAVLVGRHLFNGLDVAYATPYVARLTPRSLPLAVLNYVVLCLAAGAVIHGRPRRYDVNTAWRIGVGAAFIAAALLAIPTAIECRFLLPLWMLAYGTVAFGLAHPKPPPLTAPRRSVPGAAILAAAVALCVLLATLTYSHILGAPSSYRVWCFSCLP